VIERSNSRTNIAALPRHCGAGVKNEVASELLFGSIDKWSNMLMKNQTMLGSFEVHLTPHLHVEKRQLG
jgi:hypothetical protein